MSLEEQYEALAHFQNPGPTEGMPPVRLIDEIEQTLWLGGVVPGARLPDDFRFVLSLTNQGEYLLGPKTARRKCPFDDGPELPPDALLEELAELVNRWRTEGKVLVHCQGGRNRSGLVTALSLMRRGMSLDGAVALMREKRSPEVLWNTHFMDWLRAHAVQG